MVLVHFADMNSRSKSWAAWLIAAGMSVNEAKDLAYWTLWGEEMVRKPMERYLLEHPEEMAMFPEEMAMFRRVEGEPQQSWEDYKLPEKH
jgi:hypothetical protein